MLISRAKVENSTEFHENRLGELRWIDKSFSISLKCDFGSFLVLFHIFETTVFNVTLDGLVLSI